MSSYRKALAKAREREIIRNDKITLRKHLNADAPFATMRTGFGKIPDHHHRPGEVTILLADALMSGFAMFSLKDPSLLAFDERRHAPQNLLTNIPCDTTIREILDGVDPNNLQPLFKDAFRALQRGKVLEKMRFMDVGYLLNLDGTGYFPSKTLHSDACRQRVSKTGQVTYHLQTVRAALVHPDYKEAIVLCPEPIRQQDGQTKNDCERNAIRRLLGKLHQDHPHMEFIINED